MHREMQYLERSRDVRECVTASVRLSGTIIILPVNSSGVRVISCSGSRASGSSWLLRTPDDPYLLLCRRTAAGYLSGDVKITVVCATGKLNHLDNCSRSFTLRTYLNNLTFETLMNSSLIFDKILHRYLLSMKTQWVYLQKYVSGLLEKRFKSYC